MSDAFKRDRCEKFIEGDCSSYVQFTDTGLDATGKMVNPFTKYLEYCADCTPIIIEALGIRKEQSNDQNSV